MKSVIAVTQCLCLLVCALAQADPPKSGETACLKDAREIVRQLQENYPGYASAASRLGGALGKREAALLAAAGKTDEGAACDAKLRTFLKAFADGHLGLMSKHSQRPITQQGPPMFYEDRSPVIKSLSDQTTLLRVPSFAIQRKAALDKLLQKHDASLRAKPNLIIDLRGNTGGADSTWSEIPPMAYTKPFKVYGVLWRATEENAKALEAQGATIPKSRPALRKAMHGMAQSMREHLGELFPLGPAPTPLAFDEVWPKPTKIGVIVDGSCASSCEQLLLLLVQSERVTVFGSPTYGAFDFLNLRQAKLPSGGRQLIFAMSMSQRALKRRWDLGGIQPDEPLDASVLGDPEKAVAHVQLRLERTGRSQVSPFVTQIEMKEWRRQCQPLINLTIRPRIAQGHAGATTLGVPSLRVPRPASPEISR